MTDLKKDLVDYVYKKFLNKEIKSRKAKLEKELYFNHDNNIHLKGIKSVDKLKCEVWLYVNYRSYEFKLISADLLEGNCDNCDGKVYYSKDIMDYQATKEYDDELQKKENLPLHQIKNRMKIIKRDDVELCIDKLIVILNNLKFNTFSGEFNEYEINEQMYNIFKSPNLTIEEGEECSVCYEKTLTKTFCNHSVCYKCMENIKLDFDDEGCKEKPCPMCRKDIIYPPQ